MAVEVPPKAWFRWLKSCPSRIVRQDYIEEFLVTTAFVGLDRRLFGKGPSPLLFETTVSVEEGKHLVVAPIDPPCGAGRALRSAGLFGSAYPGWGDAGAGHAVVCAAVRATLLLET